MLGSYAYTFYELKYLLQLGGRFTRLQLNTTIYINHPNKHTVNKDEMFRAVLFLKYINISYSLHVIKRRFLTNLRAMNENELHDSYHVPKVFRLCSHSSAAVNLHIQIQAGFTRTSQSTLWTCFDDVSLWSTKHFLDLFTLYDDYSVSEVHDSEWKPKHYTGSWASSVALTFWCCHCVVEINFKDVSGVFAQWCVSR